MLFLSEFIVRWNNSDYKRWPTIPHWDVIWCIFVCHKSNLFGISLIAMFYPISVSEHAVMLLNGNWWSNCCLVPRSTILPSTTTTAMCQFCYFNLCGINYVLKPTSIFSATKLHGLIFLINDFTLCINLPKIILNVLYSIFGVMTSI